MRGISSQQNKQVINKWTTGNIQRNKTVQTSPLISKNLHNNSDITAFWETPPVNETPRNSKTKINSTKLLRHIRETFCLQTAHSDRGQVEGHYPQWAQRQKRISYLLFPIYCYYLLQVIRVQGELTFHPGGGRINIVALQLLSHCFCKYP